MGVLTEAFTPVNFPDLFTLMWAGGLLVVVGALVVYNLAMRRYRRYPVLISLHEWVFWSILVSWGIVPLLVVIHVPLLLLLLVLLPGTVVAVWAAFIRFPSRIVTANDELRRQRYVPPPRRETRERPRPTPAGRRRRHN